MSSRSCLLLCALAVAALACGEKPPAPPPPGPEVCDNKKDDNGDLKVDCADPTCFEKPACTGLLENCENGIDDDGDTLVDCADSSCAGISCGPDCLCQNGLPWYPDGGLGGGAGGGTGGSGGGTAGGSGGGAGGGTAGGSGGGTAGGAGGGAAGGAGGGAASCTGTTCGPGCACVGGVRTESACNDALDNDSDSATDCQDSDCANQPCGAGCTCLAGVKKETACGDLQDNDGDSLVDCLDPDCVGAGTEICNDGIDNTCDRAVDCADPKCSAAQCTNLSDGLACRADSQCAGARCYTESGFGAPNGFCSNAASCNTTTNAGCNGGLCRATGSPSYNICRPRCTGTGLGASGRCRPGYACFDPDTSPSNNNNFCLSLCTDDSECLGMGAGYGCNPWSKLCENKDKGQGRYGAACTSGAQCESGLCFTGSTWPGGYCAGPCRGDSRNCGAAGWCDFDPTYGDNYGTCLQQCAPAPLTSSMCRQSANYQCWRTSSGAPTAVCICLSPGQPCSFNSDCCSGSCTGVLFPTCD